MSVDDQSPLGGWWSSFEVLDYEYGGIPAEALDLADGSPDPTPGELA